MNILISKKKAPSSTKITLKYVIFSSNNNKLFLFLSSNQNSSINQHYVLFLMYNFITDQDRVTVIKSQQSERIQILKAHKKGVIGHDMALGTTWPQHNQQILKLITQTEKNLS